MELLQQSFSLFNIFDVANSSESADYSSLSPYFTYWGLQTLAMLVTAFLVPKLTITNLLGATSCVLLIALMNATEWDAALFFQFPTSVTLKAATLFLANAFLFWAAVKLAPGIEVQGLLAPLLATFLFTIFSLLIDAYGKDINWGALYKQGARKVEAVKDFVSEEKRPARKPRFTPNIEEI